MPQRKSALKELKKNHKRHMHNLDVKTEIKKTIKTFVSSVNDKKLDEAKTTLNLLYKKLDKASKTNIIKDNTASRRKARFAKMIASVK